MLIWSIKDLICSISSISQERAADDSKEVEGFQQLLLARTQVTLHLNSGKWSLGSPIMVGIRLTDLSNIMSYSVLKCNYNTVS